VRRVNGSATMTGTLTLGYRDAMAAATSPLAQAGTRVHGREFHRTVVQSPDAATATWNWSHSATPVAEGFVNGRVHADAASPAPRWPR
jgi:cobyrinic acid a,c-diamide synthase